MKQITKSLIAAAQMLEADIDKSRVLQPGSVSPNYQSSGTLQKWVNEKRSDLLNLCADPDIRNLLESWIESANDPNTIISDVAKFIAISAIPNPPDFTPELFPIYADPLRDITAILAACSGTWNNARIKYECDQIEDGEDVAAVQAAADPNATNAAAAGAVNPGNGNTSTGKGNAAPVYIAIPAAYTVTGKKAPGDYMEQLEILGYSFRLNKMTDHIEVDGKQLNDRKFSEIVLKMKENNFNSERMTEHCINVIATENEYNPIIDYFNSLSWDGMEILDQFILMMNPADPIFAGIVFRKWMIGAVAKIMEQAQNQMLVLVGKQGSGKSYFSRWLCPEPMQENYFVEDPINPDDKDFKIAACNKWLWEVKELQSTTRRADVDALKGFLTTKNFTYRPPHGRYDMTRPVTASYIGTLNDDESGFLTDVTGNRRFWIIEIGDINHAYTTIYDVNDLWAEAFARWKRGDDYNLTPDEFNLLTSKQENFKAVNNTAEAMKQYFEIDPVQTSWIMPINEVREILARRSTLSATDLQNRKMGAAAAELKLGKTFTRVNGNKTPSKCYVGIREITNISTP